MDVCSVQVLVSQSVSSTLDAYEWMINSIWSKLLNMLKVYLSHINGSPILSKLLVYIKNRNQLGFKYLSLFSVELGKVNDFEIHLHIYSIIPIVCIRPFCDFFLGGPRYILLFSPVNMVFLFGKWVIYRLFGFVSFSFIIFSRRICFIWCVFVYVSFYHLWANAWQPVIEIFSEMLMFKTDSRIKHVTGSNLFNPFNLIG